MIGPRLAAAGYPFSILVKHPPDQRLARLLDGYRAKAGVKTISAKPRRQAARQILGALRRNEVVLVLPDVFKSGSVNAQFLGSACLYSPWSRDPGFTRGRGGCSYVCHAGR